MAAPTSAAAALPAAFLSRAAAVIIVVSLPVGACVAAADAVEIFKAAGPSSFFRSLSSRSPSASGGYCMSALPTDMDSGVNVAPARDRKGVGLAFVELEACDDRSRSLASSSGEAAVGMGA